MAVYVDPLVNYGGSKSFRWKESCHMFADTEEELHEMARKIGMKRDWFQQQRTEFPHYDLVESRRIRAVKLGAVELTLRQMVEYVKARRANV
jgi:hypothetical protein